MDVFTRTLVIGADEDGDLPALVDEVRSGRRAALDGLLSRVQLRVRVWAARFTDDADAADDVAQEVLADLARRVRHFDGRSRFSTWLYTVTRNVALSQRRREQRRAALLRRHALRDGVGSTSPADADADADRRALASLALRYLDALPRTQRLIFELVDVRGLTPAEAARALRMEQGTVRVHLFKARRAIRAKLIAHLERLLTEYRS
jgi:RNA polymerase sigma-70 factor (ECF subfamily)